MPQPAALLSLKIHTASRLFPIAITCWIQSAASTHFFGPLVIGTRGIMPCFRLAIIGFGLIFRIICAHGESMPERTSSCSIVSNFISMRTTSTITVSGADALTFLQGQLSNDMTKLPLPNPMLAAWCNPKGRVITLMRVNKLGDSFELTVPAELRDDIIRRLTMFRFRSKVEFETDTDTRAVDLRETISNGVPWIGHEQSEKFTPHMLNLDRLNALSFDKGCYTGQEIVARTHYKGESKRRTLLFESDAPLFAGDRISDGQRDIGEILNAADNLLLAVVPTAKSGDALSVGDVKLTQRPLPYPLA